jgi:hypothetical protein
MPQSFIDLLYLLATPDVCRAKILVPNDRNNQLRYESHRSFLQTLDSRHKWRRRVNDQPNHCSRRIELRVSAELTNFVEPLAEGTTYALVPVTRAAALRRRSASRS